MFGGFSSDPFELIWSSPPTFQAQLGSSLAVAKAAYLAGAPHAIGSGIDSGLVHTSFSSGPPYGPILYGCPWQLSVADGGTQELNLTKSESADLLGYLLLGSTSGTSPGIQLSFPNFVSIPLNPADPYFAYTLANPNLPPLSNSLGALGSKATSVSSSFTLPPGLGPGLVGTVIHHAFVLLQDGLPVDASNAVELQLLL